MATSHRSLRVILLALAVCNGAFGSMFLLSPGMVSQLYDGVLFDYFHLYLSRGFGALFLVLGAGALIAAFRLRGSAYLILMLVLAYGALLVTDIIAIARSQIALKTLLPEMGFYLVALVILIRFFPILHSEMPKEKPQTIEETTSDLIPEGVSTEVKAEDPDEMKNAE